MPQTMPQTMPERCQKNGELAAIFMSKRYPYKKSGNCAWPIQMLPVASPARRRQAEERHKVGK
eukprot:scaffold248522_cov79-Cyclotella_meneghiniana.AAC.5